MSDLANGNNSRMKYITLDSLPDKSRTAYEKEYKVFKKWCEESGVVSVNEDVLLTYMREKSSAVKPSTLWSKFSMLKATLGINDNIHIGKFSKVLALLKRKSIGYEPTITKVLSKDQVNKFFLCADDDKYLLVKVVLMIGICGACRREELYSLRVPDIIDNGDSLTITIRDERTKRVFTVLNDCEVIYPLELFHKYARLRPQRVTHDYFFLSYQKKVCTSQRVGIHSFGRIPGLVAKYLNLPNPELYTAHCFRHTSASFAANARADITSKFFGEGNVSSYGIARGYTLKWKKAGAKTEDITSCVSESLSSEDSNHSELLHSGDPLALEDDSRPGTSSSVDFASFPGTSGVNPLPSSSFATVEMPPPRLPPSRGASPALQSMSVTQSLPLPAQNRGGERETSSEERVTPGSVGNGLNDALLETNRLDDALQRLEGISDKVNGLSGAEDNFDNFGKYVASLLRGLPTSKVADVQQQVINLILSSHISPDAPSGDLNSSSSAGIAPSCSTSETLPTPKPPPPPPPPQTHSPAQSTPTSALQSNSKSTSQPQQTKKGEKRPHAHDDSPSGVGNKQVKLEDTEQIDATLKRLEEISDRVNQLGGRDDSFDVFGKYAASILRCLPPQRAMELQKEVVNLILREQGDSMTQTARRFHAAATVAVS